MVKFDHPREPSFLKQNDKSMAPYNLITILGAKRLLKKGSQRYLAVVKDVKSLDATLIEVPIVNEFIDVFLEKLLWLPSKRTFEFCIALILDMQPILIPLYHMALANLRELKDQLKDLWIRTSSNCALFHGVL